MRTDEICTGCPKSSCTYLVPLQLEDEASDVQEGAAWYVEQSELPSYREAAVTPSVAPGQSEMLDLVFGSDRGANAS